MKKHLFLFGILAGLASAESLSYSEMHDGLKSGLLTSYSFTDGGTADYTATGFELKMWNGSSAVTGVFKTENGHAIVGSNGTTIYNMLGSGTLSGSSFTISFDLVSVQNTQAKGAIISLYSHNTTTDGTKYALSIRAGANTTDSIVVSTGESDEVGFDGTTTYQTIDSGIAGNAATFGQTLTLVSDGTNKLLTLYVDGTEQGKIENWESQNLTGIQFGGFAGNKTQISSAALDNISIWNRALEASEVQSLQVPEPATATLSLLALAGLAARRRRQA